MAEVTGKCTDGHTFDYFAEQCSKCGITFDEYKKSMRVYSIDCECGAEKAGFDTHAHWCPRGEK